MAYGIIKQSEDIAAHVNEYIVDTEADVRTLPFDRGMVDPGSTCLVVETGNIYILNNKQQWVLFT